MKGKWSDAPEHIPPKRKEGEEFQGSSLHSLVQNTLLLTPGALFKYCTQYLLLSNTLLLCSSVTSYQDVSSMKAKPHGLICHFLHSSGHREGARHLLNKRIRGQVYFVLYPSDAYHRVRHATSAQKLSWLLCEAILNIIAIGRSVSSS